MSQTKTILFPTDFSDESLNALNLAIDYAKKSNSTLTLINVIEYPWKVLDIVSNSITKNIFDRSEVKLTTKFLLRKLSKKIKSKNGINVNYKIFYGNLLKSLLGYIDKTKVDLLVLGTKGGKSSLLSKSKAYEIADHSPISTITVNANSEFKNIRKILFPISDKIYTTKKIKEIARIGKVYKAEVILLGITPNDTESLDEMSFYMETLLKKLKAQNINTQIKMSIGKDYAKEINEFSNENKIDLIGIISNFEHGPLSIFTHSPDEKLINGSEIPILSVPLEIPTTIQSHIEIPYISPWSMKYDVNKVIIP